MDQAERERLRRLALWLARRRETDEALSQLTRYGPSASQQVATHLTALRDLLAREADAFGAVEAVSDVVRQRDLPSTADDVAQAVAVEADEVAPAVLDQAGSAVLDQATATVHSLDLARDRREQV